MKLILNLVQYNGTKGEELNSIRFYPESEYCYHRRYRTKREEKIGRKSNRKCGVKANRKFL